jgi:hypothetical protein
MKADKASVDKVESALVESMGKEFPGSIGLWHFRAAIDAPVTLDDFVGQAGKLPDTVRNQRGGVSDASVLPISRPCQRR